MTARKADRFAEILLVRRLQREVAERLAGTATDAVRRLEAGRGPLQQALDEMVGGFRRHLMERSFDPMMSAGWLELVAEGDEALVDHDGQIDLAREEAQEAERGWYRAQGREALAGDLARQAGRRERRLAEERRMADHADRLLLRERSR